MLKYLSEYVYIWTVTAFEVDYCTKYPLKFWLNQKALKKWLLLFINVCVAVYVVYKVFNGVDYKRTRALTVKKTNENNNNNSPEQISIQVETTSMLKKNNNNNFPLFSGGSFMCTTNISVSSRSVLWRQNILLWSQLKKNTTIQWQSSFMKCSIIDEFNVQLYILHYSWNVTAIFIIWTRLKPKIR